MRQKVLVFILALATLNLNYSNIYTDNSKSNEVVKKSNKIIIDKINIDKEYSISNMYDNINGIVMFNECGRPDIDGDNTVIGAHSGYGSNVYFNFLNKLDKSDKIRLIYNNFEYEYEVYDVKYVNDTDIDVLKSNGSSILTLLTCKIGDSSKRLIVSANLIGKI